MRVRLRHRPTEVTAIVWTGRNVAEVGAFLGNDWLGETTDGRLRIRTWNGPVYARRGEYVVRGVEGEFYPLDPKVAVETYEVIG